MSWEKSPAFLDGLRGLGLIISLLFSMPVSVKHAVKRIISVA
jgi:hypothetical protein